MATIYGFTAKSTQENKKVTDATDKMQIQWVVMH